MAYVESVKIDGRGRIQRSKKRKLRGRKVNRLDQSVKNFTRSNLKNLTKSDKHYDAGVFKNARIMKNNKNSVLNPNRPYEIFKRDSVVYPYDGRCHPAKTSRK
jgi:hypothetical protein